MWKILDKNSFLIMLQSFMSEIGRDNSPQLSKIEYNKSKNRVEKWGVGKRK